MAEASNHKTLKHIIDMCSVFFIGCFLIGTILNLLVAIFHWKLYKIGGWPIQGWMIFISVVAVIPATIWMGLRAQEKYGNNPDSFKRTKLGNICRFIFFILLSVLFIWNLFK